MCGFGHHGGSRELYMYGYKVGCYKQQVVESKDKLRLTDAARGYRSTDYICIIDFIVDK